MTSAHPAGNTMSERVGEGAPPSAGLPPSESGWRSRSTGAEAGALGSSGLIEGWGRMDASIEGSTLWTDIGPVSGSVWVRVRVSPCPAPEEGVRRLDGMAGSGAVVLPPSEKETDVWEPARWRMAATGVEVNGAITLELPKPVVTACGP